MILIFQLGISRAWPAAAAAQFQRNDGREGGKDKQGRGERWKREDALSSPAMISRVGKVLLLLFNDT